MAESLLAQQDRECGHCPECPVCYLKLHENPRCVALVPCGHTYHYECAVLAKKAQENLVQYRKVEWKCSVCRK